MSVYSYQSQQPENYYWFSHKPPPTYSQTIYFSWTPTYMSALPNLPSPFPLYLTLLEKLSVQGIVWDPKLQKKSWACTYLKITKIVLNTKNWERGLYCFGLASSALACFFLLILNFHSWISYLILSLVHDLKYISVL